MVRAHSPAARASQRPVWAAGVRGSRQPTPGRLRVCDTQRPQVASRARPSNSSIPAAPSRNQAVYQAGLVGRMTAGKTNSPRAGTRASRGWRARKASPSAAVATAQAPAQVSRTNSVVTSTGAACSLTAVMAVEAARAISARVSRVGTTSSRVAGKSRIPATTTNPATMATRDSSWPTPSRRSRAASPRAAAMVSQVGSSQALPTYSRLSDSEAPASRPARASACA
jgi:hypothetical protein